MLNLASLDVNINTYLNRLNCLVDLIQRSRVQSPPGSKWSRLPFLSRNYRVAFFSRDHNKIQIKHFSSFTSQKCFTAYKHCSLHQNNLKSQQVYGVKHGWKQTSRVVVWWLSLQIKVQSWSICPKDLRSGLNL